MLRLYRYFHALALGCLIACLLLLAFSGIVLAIDDPDSITIRTVRAYEGLWEEDDMLFVVEYDVEYGIDPVEDPDETYAVGIWSPTLVKGPDRPLNYYQHNVISVYLTPAQVTSFGYAVDDELRIRVFGNPTFFPSLTEGVNMRTVTLSPTHWTSGSTLAITRTALGNRVITIAGSLETSWGITLLTTNDKLNSVGKATFEEAIPGLQGICPDIFQLAVTTPAVPAGPGDPVFEEGLQTRMGARLEGSMRGISTWILGDDSHYLLIAGLCLGMVYFVLAGRIFIATGSVPGAIVVSLPFLFVGNLVGLLPLSFTFVAAFLVTVTFGVTFVLARL